MGVAAKGEVMTAGVRYDNDPEKGFAGEWGSKWDEAFAKRWKRGPRGGLVPIGPMLTKRSDARHYPGAMNSTQTILAIELQINGGVQLSRVTTEEKP